MLAGAFGLVGKAWKRTPVQPSTSLRRRSHMPPQLSHLHSTPAQRETFPEQQQLLQSNSGDTAGGSFEQRFATLKSIVEDRVNDRTFFCGRIVKSYMLKLITVYTMKCSYGRMVGIIKTLCVNKIVKSGCKVKILMTDWFAQMNRNIGSNLNKMQSIGSYNIEIWKAADMALDRVELVWLSDEINRHADEYWQLAMDVSRKTTVCGIKRCYGSRDPFEEFTAADVFFPSLQCATILFQKVIFFFLFENIQP
ncbi:Tyrosine--tRNA ligase 1, cytoplasmic [Dichanthelium oligosanthes]|uniref:Tyrosine--tRNA ligase 1, cytoplasmic n=1 Tax=Dichanthelium oligosanthes TaxID=888268 RepID=A0A1E5UI22_9POAL|nr:Tyrosine--tRNA ligase 1, cytoplasmic [Dichanthelium oligosanthes]